MACALTGSQGLDCKDSIGGIKELKIKAHPGLAEIEANFTQTSGSVTVIASGSRSGWYTYQMEKEQGSASDNPQPVPANGSLWFSQELKLILNKMSARLNYEIQQLGKNRLIIAVRDMNDRYFIIGLKYGADLTTATATTGAARGDRNGYDLTFIAKEDLPTQDISAAIWATLVS